MTIEITIEATEGLSEDTLQKVYEYIQFLKYNMSIQGENISSVTKAEVKKFFHKRTSGGMEGIFFMADDFDETPNCFQEYM